MTRTGDDGTTSLMFGRRLAKNHPRVETYGAVDELNSALGMARAAWLDLGWKQTILSLQKDLIALMGTLAVAPEDRERYAQAGYAKLKPEHLEKLDQLGAFLEGLGLAEVHDWVMPGECLAGAALDMARTVCRRAERRFSDLLERKEDDDPLICQYLNRMSDVCWLLGRAADKKMRAPNIA